MATIKHYKVVAALPSTLVADSIYLVRVGTGFDLYVTNSSGTIVAYPANYQAGSANLSALSGLTGAANKAPYFTAAGAMAVYDLTVFGRSFSAAADAAAGRTLLGLGTAATRAATTSATDTTSERLWRTNDLVKQTNQRDTTAGSVLLTGAGGWMGTAPFLTGNDYNNDSEYCGIVKNDNNIPAVNYPPQISANAPMAALNVRFNGSYGWQLGVQTPGSSPSDAALRAFLRQEVGGAWGNWAELWHSKNMLYLGATPEAARAAMGLGSAALLTATASATDATTGRALKVGDFGIGASGTTPLADAAVTASGLAVYTTGSSTVDAPNSWGTLLNVRGNVSGFGHGFQIAKGNGSSNFYMRGSSGTTPFAWEPWQTLWHSGNFNPAAKQDAIAAGTTAQFRRGDKTWQDLAAAVRAAVLTGLSTVSAAAVSATDTVLAAIGKLQAQINGLSAASYTNLTLLAPYTWDSAGDAADYSQPSYAKVGDVVRLRGKVTLSGTHTSNSTVNVTTIATLPVGFRPAKRKAFQVFWDTDSPLFFAYCLVFVNTNGTIVLVALASNQTYPFTEGHLPLDQIWFDVAA